MPTSTDEARQIVKIINDFIESAVAQTLTQRLHDEVGQHTDNKSLAVSLEMLKDLYNSSEDLKKI
jgi:hypothetical protein